MVPRIWLIPVVLVISLLLSGCTQLPGAKDLNPFDTSLSPADQCNTTCTNLGYENWALLSPVDSPGDFECKCTYLKCTDTESAGAIIRACNPVSDIYPIQ